MTLTEAILIRSRGERIWPNRRTPDDWTQKEYDQRVSVPLERFFGAVLPPAEPEGPAPGKPAEEPSEGLSGPETEGSEESVREEAEAQTPPPPPSGEVPHE